MLTIPLRPGRARGRRAAVPMAWTAAATVACALAAAGLLTACGSAQAPSASGQQTQRADSAPSPVTGPSTVPGMGGLAVCPSATLKVALGTSQAGGAMGSAYYPVNFTNTSDAPCGMYGYPDLSFVTSAGSSGVQIGAAAQENPAFGRLAVRVPAGGVAHAWLQVAAAGNYPASTCHPATAHGLRVYPPGDTVASYVGVSFAACGSASTPLLTVMPVRSGHGVRGVTP
jgi:Protein of unknown function (DUF4232)